MSDEYEYRSLITVPCPLSPDYPSPTFPDWSAVILKDVDETVRSALGSIDAFCALHGFNLRSYQSEVTLAIWDMLRGHGGRSMAVMFPRQSGKNVLQTSLEAYLLMVCHLSNDAEIVKIAPTWRPQAVSAMGKLQKALKENVIARKLGWTKEQGMAIRVGGARISFYSGMPGANIVGATASLLLSIDEAQDISVEHYDTQIAPMAAAKNAARIFWGTAWTADTLLAREYRLAAQNQEAPSGEKQRAFATDAVRVGKEVPAYRAFVAEQVARLGRDHPAVRTQYFNEEIDAAGGLFPADALAQTRGEHRWQERPQANRIYAFLLDVGGEQTGTTLEAPREHDATALVIVEVESGSAGQPVYRAVHLRSWSGVGQPALEEELCDLAQRWRPRKVVIDATGLGQGLAAGLELNPLLRGRVIRFTFTTSSKTSLGWGFTGLVSRGRFRLPKDGGALVELLREQMARCAKEVGSGPGEALRWGVPDGARANDGTPLHDDLLTAAALCIKLDEEAWPLRSLGKIIQARDPLAEMDRGGRREE
jgi:hypothetical protein